MASETGLCLPEAFRDEDFWTSRGEKVYASWDDMDSVSASQLLLFVVWKDGIDDTDPE